MGGTSPQRNGASHASIAPYGPFTSGDGGVVILGVQNEREWRRFCELVLREPSLATDERFSGNAQRVANRRVLQQSIEEIFSQLSREEIISRLELANIANAEMRTMEQFLDHPQLAARERWREVDSPAGKIPALLPPVNMEGVEPVIGPIPVLGEHTEQIMKGLDYNPAEIARLRAEQVL
jgi:itaconate CoA-transferase